MIGKFKKLLSLKEDFPYISMTEEFPNWTEWIRKIRIAMLSLVIIILLASFSLNNAILMLILWFVSVALLIKQFSWFKHLETFFQKKYYYHHLLLEFIIQNNLYKEVNGTVEMSATLTYLEKHEEIIVFALKHGTPFDSRLEKLDVELQGLLHLPLTDKIVSHDMVEYHFKEVKEIEQIIFSSDQLGKDFFDSIPLDTIVLSPTQSFSLKSSSMMGLYGRTGSGKTIALQWYLYSAIAKGCGTDSNSVLTIVDGKGGDLYSLGRILEDELVGNFSVGQTGHALAKLSREFVEAMDARFEMIGESKTLNADGYDLGLTPNFIFIDELASIRDSCGSSKQGKELWNEILQNLGLIARKGRQASCHLCVSTQDPNAENIPVELRLQITSVLYLSNPGTDRLKMAFSMCELENVPTLSGRKGEALFYADGLKMVEPEITVVPFVDVKSKADFLNVVKKIKPNLQ
jgi:hypothetical protein